MSSTISYQRKKALLLISERNRRRTITTPSISSLSSSSSMTSYGYENRHGKMMNCNNADVDSTQDNDNNNSQNPRRKKKTILLYPENNESVSVTSGTTISHDADLILLQEQQDVDEEDDDEGKIFSSSRHSRHFCSSFDIDHDNDSQVGGEGDWEDVPHDETIQDGTDNNSTIPDHQDYKNTTTSKSSNTIPQRTSSLVDQEEYHPNIPLDEEEEGFITPIKVVGKSKSTDEDNCKVTTPETVSTAATTLTTNSPSTLVDDLVDPIQDFCFCTSSSTTTLPDMICESATKAMTTVFELAYQDDGDEAEESSKQNRKDQEHEANEQIKIQQEKEQPNDIHPSQTTTSLPSILSCPEFLCNPTTDLDMDLLECAQPEDFFDVNGDVLPPRKDENTVKEEEELIPALQGLFAPSLRVSPILKKNDDSPTIRLIKEEEEWNVVPTSLSMPCLEEYFLLENDPTPTVTQGTTSPPDLCENNNNDPNKRTPLVMEDQHDNDDFVTVQILNDITNKNIDSNTRKTDNDDDDDVSADDEDKEPPRITKRNQINKSLHKFLMSRQPVRKLNLYVDEYPTSTFDQIVENLYGYRSLKTIEISRTVAITTAANEEQLDSATRRSVEEMGWLLEAIRCLPFLKKLILTNFTSSLLPKVVHNLPTSLIHLSLHFLDTTEISCSNKNTDTLLKQLSMKKNLSHLELEGPGSIDIGRLFTKGSNIESLDVWSGTTGTTNYSMDLAHIQYFADTLQKNIDCCPLQILDLQPIMDNSTWKALALGLKGNLQIHTLRVNVNDSTVEDKDDIAMNVANLFKINTNLRYIFNYSHDTLIISQPILAGPVLDALRNNVSVLKLCFFHEDPLFWVAKDVILQRNHEEKGIFGDVFVSPCANVISRLPSMTTHFCGGGAD